MIPSPPPSPTTTHPPIIYLQFDSAAWGSLALVCTLHTVHSNIEYWILNIEYIKLLGWQI